MGSGHMAFMATGGSVTSGPWLAGVDREMGVRVCRGCHLNLCEQQSLRTDLQSPLGDARAGRGQFVVHAWPMAKWITSSPDGLELPHVEESVG